MTKKHFLVVWPSQRKDWLSAFVKLKGHFDFTFLPGSYPQEPNYAKEFSCRYWSEFSSIQHVLEEIRPDGIIFMSIETGLSISLNFIAKSRGIRTIILQHGIFTNYRDYRIREKIWRKNSKAKQSKGEHASKVFNTKEILKVSFRGRELRHFFVIAIYILLQRRFGMYWAAKHLPIKLKVADQYLCYSPYNTKIHIETDRISKSQISYVGCPELIDFLKEETEANQEPYYLHIDQAFAENSFGEEILDKTAMINYYLSINNYCLEKHARLVIKLHPESFDSDWLPKHKNIKYLRSTLNFNQVIQGAIGCFGFFSTLVIPAIYWKPTILFRIGYSGLQSELEKMGAIQVLDFWHFKPEQFQFRKFEKSELIKEYFILPPGTNEKSLLEALDV